MIESLEEDFRVMNGDILTDLNLTNLLNFIKKKPIASIVVYKKIVQIDLGTLDDDGDLIITNYIEKPKIEYLVSTGIYVFNANVKKYLEYNRSQKHIYYKISFYC